MRLVRNLGLQAKRHGLLTACFFANYLATLYFLLTTQGHVAARWPWGQPGRFIPYPSAGSTSTGMGLSRSSRPVMLS